MSDDKPEVRELLDLIWDMTKWSLHGSGYTWMGLMSAPGAARSTEMAGMAVRLRDTLAKYDRRRFANKRRRACSRCERRKHQEDDE